MVYLKENKVYSRYPKISDQIETVPFDSSKLYPFGYNPSLVDFRGHILLAYRYHPGADMATKLAVCGLDHGVPSNNQTIEVEGGSVEDPKFFVFCEELFVSFVDSTVPQMPFSCVIKYGRLENNKLLDLVQPNYGFNAGGMMEKNWVFWASDHEGRDSEQLKCLYCCAPQQKIYLPMLAQSEQPRWPYGLIKGGTQPMPYEGKWIRFFHSTLDNDMGLQARRYYVGALIMNTKPPFETVAVSKKPILYGSEVDGLTKDQRKACHHWKPQVVFPGTALEREGGWWLPCGINDSACLIAKIQPKDLQL